MRVCHVPDPVPRSRENTHLSGLHGQSGSTLEGGREGGGGREDEGGRGRE